MFEIQKPNVAKEKISYFCDYVELLCLLQNSDILSISDIIVRLDLKIDLHKKNEIGDLNSEINDENEEYIYNLFEILKKRAEIFNDIYPFIVTSNYIKMKDVSLSNKEKSYIFLLLCSNLESFKQYQSILTDDFEKFAYMSLKNFFSDKIIIKQFGKNKTSSDYIGKLYEKLEKLSQDLNLNIKIPSRKLSKYNSGDGGIDIIAWYRYEEINNDYTMIYLFQCASGKNWLKKQDETDKFSNLIDFSQNYLIKGMIIPFDNRDIDRDFIEEKDITSKLILDRIRLLEYFNYDEIINFKSINIVNEIIKYEEDIV